MKKRDKLTIDEICFYNNIVNNILYIFFAIYIGMSVVGDYEKIIDLDFYKKSTGLLISNAVIINSAMIGVFLIVLTIINRYAYKKNNSIMAKMLLISQVLVIGITMLFTFLVN